MTEFGIFALIATSAILVQSTMGFAGALVAIPLFALFMSPQEAVPAYCFLELAMDFFLVCEGRRHVEWRSVRGLLLGALPAVPIGALALKHLPVHAIGATISAVTLLFGILFLTRARVRFPVHPLTEPAVGLLSGMLGGSIFQSGPPVVVYGLSRDWAKDVFRSSLLAYFLCLASTAAVSYTALGMVNSHLLLLSGAALLPALAAAHLGAGELAAARGEPAASETDAAAGTPHAIAPPDGLFSALILPELAFTSPWTMARPSPVPLVRWARSPRKKRWKRLGKSAGAMPHPESATVTTAQCCLCVTATLSPPPWGMASRAFLIRFIKA